MKKQKLIIMVAIVAILAVGGMVFATRDSGSNASNEKMTAQANSDSAMMEKDKSAEAVEKDKMAMAEENKSAPDVVQKTETPAQSQPTEQAAQKPVAIAKSGNYVTLDDYNKDSAKYSDSKKIYFFHASWCPTCQGIDKAIKADMSKIPSGVTIIKTDFDNSNDLRKKYGVTYQYTFVQVDNSGNQTAKWSATSFDKVISGIN